MIRAFLSHSSSDKDFYVRKVAEWLGKDNIIYDEFTFEEGEKALDEILKGLDKTDLFVLFLSNNALNSDWVKREITEAKNRLNESQISKIFPIIIEDGITYEDKRIPQWLKNTYNIKPIKRAQVAAKKIHNKLREISWTKHPQLKKRQNLFVGRNSEQEAFEERIHDFDKLKPLVVIASSIPGVGRRTFLHKALVKTNITDCPHQPSSIFLDRNVSIEDFILKLNDLGFIDFGNKLLSLSDKSIDDKIELIHQIMNATYENKELIYIVDDGCLVNYERKVTKWFEDTIMTYEKSNYPIFCIASRYQVNFSNRPNGDKFYFVKLNELNPNERKRLFSQLLDIYKIDLSKEDFNMVLELLFGFPEQIMFAVDLIKEDNSPIVNKLSILTSYNSDKAAVILNKYEKDDKTLSFIRLLAQFDIISCDFIFLIVDEKIYFPILEKLVSEHVCELIGIDGEIIRLNDIIRDYIKRNKIELEVEYKTKINLLVKKLVEKDDIFERDSSEYIFAMKEALRTGISIDERLLIPSHYLRCMKDMYYNNGSLDRIIELADIILQKKDNLEEFVLQDIRYYLCLALARKQDGRFLSEVQFIRGDEHPFLLGYYYRLNGRYDDALTQFNMIKDALYVGSRCKREIVQVYVQLGEYEKGLKFARKNYEENRGNQFHTQAYFNCLINSENPKENDVELKLLIQNLRTIDSEQSNEMADIANAMYIARVENNKIKSFDSISDTVNKYPENHYPLLSQCDIALKYMDLEKLEEGIKKLDNLKKDRRVSSKTLNKYKSYLLALQGYSDDAINLIANDLARYPEESKNKIITKLKELSLINNK
ncbi:MAG: toll/interleukin-1 receptor domain-containing protein [Aliarcobacter sp.]|nr:toll/interleukin-1 receptor domain-containing protein [Aliarcobacter sp.]